MNNLSDLILRALDAELVPFLEGKPGSGKTQTIRNVADECNLKLIDVRLATMDVTDISGLPTKVTVNSVNGTKDERILHIPSTLFPLEGDELPLKYKNGKTYYEDEIDTKGNPVLDKKTGKPNQVLARYDGWLICFEEITSCVPAMQAAAFRILLEREVGERKLHPCVEMVATGNRKQDKAVVVPMSTPMRTRLCFIEVKDDFNAWVRWARKNNVDDRIISYLQWRPEMLFAFDPNIEQLNCPVPRTWEFADRLLKQDTGTYDQPDSLTCELLAGVIGKAIHEFLSFLAIYKNLISINEILKDPANAELPPEGGHQFALTGIIANELAKDKNVKDLAIYIDRMEPELQTVTYMDGFRKNRKIMGNAAVLSWVQKNQDMINAEI